jgi:hypothetical protein
MSMVSGIGVDGGTVVHDLALAGGSIGVHGRAIRRSCNPCSSRSP